MSPRHHGSESDDGSVSESTSNTSGPVGTLAADTQAMKTYYLERWREEVLASRDQVVGGDPLVRGGVSNQMDAMVLSLNGYTETVVDTIETMAATVGNHGESPMAAAANLMEANESDSVVRGNFFRP